MACERHGRHMVVISRAYLLVPEGRGQLCDVIGGAMREELLGGGGRGGEGGRAVGEGEQGADLRGVQNYFFRP